MIILFYLILVWALSIIFVPPEGLRGIARTRLYKSGTGWCFWRWTDVDSEYITRLHILKTPYFAVCLHWINSPDVEPWLHDHPVSFLSVILRGKYAELRKRPGKPLELLVHRWFNFIRASDKDSHRITLVRKNTLTLCFMGPKTREWGFHVGDLLQPAPTIFGPAGWIHWKDYYARLKAGEDMRCGPLGLFNKVATGRYTDERMRAMAGSPVGTQTDEEKREIDTGVSEPFDAEEVTAEYEVHRG